MFIEGQGSVQAFSGRVPLPGVQVAQAQVVEDLPVLLLASVLRLLVGLDSWCGNEGMDPLAIIGKCVLPSLCLPRRKSDLAICLMLFALLGLRILQTWNCSKDS